MEEYDFISGEEWSEETAEEIESEEETIEERINGWRELNDLRWFSEIPVVPQPIIANSNRLNHETETTLLQQWKASAPAAAKKQPRLNLEGKTLREVEEAAERIKIGEKFISFDDFEYCLDCWCALHLRSSHKFKILPTCRVRVCRYGRPLWKYGGEKVIEWPSVPPRPSAAVGPSAAGVRSFQDFRQGSIHGWRGPLDRATWLATVFGNRIALDFNRPIGQLLNEFRANFYKDVQYPPMFRMRQRCQDDLTGSDANAFSQIPALLDRIQEADPRAVVNHTT
ncbi:hypothetical protein R1sor_000848 [Riccia sorocarpa]|uniref:Uncharacterized protein n=1 Tax=Riccia sorocarpa TaxID=122646 RepID=A0ABD3GYI1_9MARC